MHVISKWWGGNKMEGISFQGVSKIKWTTWLPCQNWNKTHYKIVEHWIFSFQWLDMIYIYPNVLWFSSFKL
jgi:hypothetical protein